MLVKPVSLLHLGLTAEQRLTGHRRDGFGDYTAGGDKEKAEDLDVVKRGLLMGFMTAAEKRIQV